LEFEFASSFDFEFPVSLVTLMDWLADGSGRVPGRVKSKNPSVKCGYGRVDGSGE
jgi:hypothetical protein